MNDDDTVPTTEPPKVTEELRLRIPCTPQPRQQDRTPEMVWTLTADQVRVEFANVVRYVPVSVMLDAADRVKARRPPTPTLRLKRNAGIPSAAPGLKDEA